MGGLKIGPVVLDGRFEERSRDMGRGFGERPNDMGGGLESGPVALDGKFGERRTGTGWKVRKEAQ